MLPQQETRAKLLLGTLVNKLVDQYYEKLQDVLQLSGEDNLQQAIIATLNVLPLYVPYGVFQKGDIVTTLEYFLGLIIPLSLREGPLFSQASDDEFFTCVLSREGVRLWKETLAITGQKPTPGNLKAYEKMITALTRPYTSFYNA